jgi:protein-S-isoprenylcysteine O-methyltransferase Ste14
VLVAAFVRFAWEGIGTPAPVAPTEHVVVGGLYRYVRNPMYLAVTALFAGQALLLSACQPKTRAIDTVAPGRWFAWVSASGVVCGGFVVDWAGCGCRW